MKFVLVRTGYCQLHGMAGYNDLINIMCFVAQSVSGCNLQSFSHKLRCEKPLGPAQDHLKLLLIKRLKRPSVFSFLAKPM